MISTTLPSGDALDVVACYIQSGDVFLLLKRSQHKPHGNRWGLPAGKVDGDETPLEAIVREVREETGISVNPFECRALPSLWVEHEGFSFRYHSFMVTLPSIPSIELNTEEHSDYTWVTAVESLKMDLIHDLDACNRLFLNV
jgi:8-oxo-dGTP pyrophosphatase MutT (NUDIX family)